MGNPMGTGKNGLKRPRQNLATPLIGGFILPEDSAYVVFCWQDVTLRSIDVSLKIMRLLLSH